MDTKTDLCLTSFAPIADVLDDAHLTQSQGPDTPQDLVLVQYLLNDQAREDPIHLFDVSTEHFGHPEGSPKPDPDNPFVLKLSPTKLNAEFEDNQNSRIFYERVTASGSRRYELQVNQITTLKILENPFKYLGFIVVHSNPKWKHKPIDCQNVLRTQSKSKRKRKSPLENVAEDHKCPIKVKSESDEAIYVDFEDDIFKTCHGGVVEAGTNQTLLIEPTMISTQELDEFGNRKYIQICPRMSQNVL